MGRLPAPYGEPSRATMTVRLCHAHAHHPGVKPVGHDWWEMVDTFMPRGSAPVDGSPVDGAPVDGAPTANSPATPPQRCSPATDKRDTE